MPTYDYRCRSCGRTYEVIHSMLEDGPTTCEHCGGELRRILYPTGIIFKGSGFYSTDARASAASRGSGGSAAKNPEGAGAAADAKSAEQGGASSGSESAAAATTGDAAAGKAKPDAKSSVGE